MAPLKVGVVLLQEGVAPLQEGVAPLQRGVAPLQGGLARTGAPGLARTYAGCGRRGGGSGAAA